MENWRIFSKEADKEKTLFRYIWIWGLQMVLCFHICQINSWYPFFYFSRHDIWYNIYVSFDSYSRLYLVELSAFVILVLMCIYIFSDPFWWFLFSLWAGVYLFSQMETTSTFCPCIWRLQIHIVCPMIGVDMQSSASQ
jgi:hypothetical protein